MFCSKCGRHHDANEAFCRNCGTSLRQSVTTVVDQNLSAKTSSSFSSNDPDELTGNGIGGVIVGDGLFMVAIFLSVTHSSVSSLLWLLLLIPAFFFFGKGASELLKAKQIRRRLKQGELAAAPDPIPLFQPASIATALQRTSAELLAPLTVTDRTTRELS